MKQETLSFVLAGLLVGMVVSDGYAANEFRVGDVAAQVGETGVSVPVYGVLDQDTYAFSVHLKFDQTKIQLTGVQLGAAAVALTPEYDEGMISNNPGDLVYGVVFDLSDPIDKKLPQSSPATQAKELLVLTVNVLSATAGSVKLDLVDDAAPPSKLNVMTNQEGKSVTGITLTDGTLTFSDPAELAPRIDSFVNNSGVTGNAFIVVGQNFDLSGFQLFVGGVEVAESDYTLLGDNQTLNVTAPACVAAGWASVRVCNDYGCDEEPQGFNYTSCGGGGETEFRRGDANNDATVDISDGIAILSDLFLGVSAPAPCRDAMDSDDSGSLDITDGIYLLNFLFQGGPAILPPYPGLGVDPTPDALPAC